jgi:hypothetical protein
MHEPVPAQPVQAAPDPGLPALPLPRFTQVGGHFRTMRVDNGAERR